MSTDSNTPRLPRRRRALVGLTVSASFLLLGTSIYLTRPTPVQRLQPYLGQDLRTLAEDDQIKVDGLIGRLAPEARRFTASDRPRNWGQGAWRDYLTAKKATPLFSPRSWYLWQVQNGQRQERLVLFQGKPLFMIPDASSAHVFVFDAEGRRLTESEFLTGWRINIDDACWLVDSGHGFSCLLVRSSASINGLDVGCQYYTLLQDSIALVRLEDSEGKSVQVDYHSPNHTIGPPVPERSPEESETLLRSSDNAEVLRTLVWLGGHHSDPPQDEKGLCVERFEDATRALATRRRPGVRSAVEALTRSEDVWVREAAQQAWEAIQVAGR